MNGIHCDRCSTTCGCVRHGDGWRCGLCLAGERNRLLTLLESALKNRAMSAKKWSEWLDDEVRPVLEDVKRKGQ